MMLAHLFGNLVLLLQRHSLALSVLLHHFESE
jgi:hypothetical protein